jgi:hypothetical protein
VPAKLTRAERDSAVFVLITHLRSTEHEVSVLRTPDPTGGLDGAFELNVDGELVAVDVVPLSMEATQYRRVAQLQEAVAAAVRPLVSDRGLGLLAGDIRLRGRIGRREAPALEDALVRAISDSLGGLEGTDRIAVDDPPRPVSSLSIERLGRGTHDFGFVTAPFDAFDLDGQLDDFIQWLLRTSESRMADYADARLVILDRTFVASSDDLRSGFRRAGAEVPPNLTTVYFIPRRNAPQDLTVYRR